jgi:lysophospholipase L1-like esterase
VIDELKESNNIPVTPPDFYCFFENNTDQIADALHPNGYGYQSMAAIWHDALIGDRYPGCQP